MVFDFFAKPVRIEGDGRAERIIVERTELDESGAARGHRRDLRVPASPDRHLDRLSDAADRRRPYDERGGKFANDQGRIGDGLYAVGWARRGPTGTIGTNRPDGYEVAEQVAAAMPPGSDGGKAGARASSDRCSKARGQADQLRRLAEDRGRRRPRRARRGSPREKFVRLEDWLKVLGH